AWKGFLTSATGPSMGHLCYELKDGSEGLHAALGEAQRLPLLHWFEPELLLETQDGITTMRCDQARKPLAQVIVEKLGETVHHSPRHAERAEWQIRTSRSAYLASVDRLMYHLRRGDLYEINYCVERTAKLFRWDPFRAFHELLRHTDAPFASFYRYGHIFVLCASPERFLEIRNGRIRTEPMKGTRPRDPDPGRDAELVHALRTDAKERSENIMATDVARHDLGQVAEPGSVEVSELCGVRTFRSVHQMVSRVEARLRGDLHPVDAVRAAWPMASMTGAPKISAMRWINEVETKPRGLFSGSLGWAEPRGGLDLNVVIRTIVHDAATGHTSLITGGALTAACDPEREWEECALKASTVLRAIGHEN
ncbi:MAG TPA: anthranilate synthase component I family protein, partial [Flavobacteriales bacterium]|nr:anthranilate synthase component I family protein [Flavobacteriales bacterium]